MAKKKIRRSKKEQNQQIVHEYMSEKHTNEVDPDDLTSWAIDTKRAVNQESDFFLRVKKDLIQAMRDEHRVDPQGRDVRTMIAIRGKKQKSLWLELYEAPADKTLIALSQQRRGIVAHCFHHKQTTESWNDNNVHGAQIPLFDYNINKDLAEKGMPTDYPDEAPPEDD